MFILCREMCLNDDEVQVPHISSHQDDLELETLYKYITCNVCGKRFVNKILYKYHKFKSEECSDNIQPENCAPIAENPVEDNNEANIGLDVAVPKEEPEWHDRWSDCAKAEVNLCYEPIKCNSCKDDQLYYSDTELEYHRETKHKPNSYKPPKTLCLVCAKSFQTRKSLISHFKVHHLLSAPDSTRVERKIYVCDICHHVFFNPAILQLHIFTRHWFVYRSHSVTCLHCDRLVKRSSVWNHIECYGFKRVTTCPICLKRFHSRSAVLKHIESHSPTLVCDICSYDTSKRVFYINHLRHSHSATQFNKIDEYKKFFIGSCKTRNWWYKPPYVTKGVKLDGTANICVLCRAICLNDDEMQSHISMHQPDVALETLSKFISCNVCGEKFVNKILYKYHKFRSECTEQIKNENCAPVAENPVEDIEANGGLDVAVSKQESDL